MPLCAIVWLIDFVNWRSTLVNKRSENKFQMNWPFVEQTIISLIIESIVHFLNDLKLNSYQ